MCRIGKLGAIVNKYNSTYHSTIKMKPVDAKSGVYCDFDKNNNKKDSHLKWSSCNNIKIQKHFWKILHSELVWRRFWY